MKLAQSVADTRGVAGIGPTRQANTADFALARFYIKAFHTNTRDSRRGARGETLGWRGGDAWIARLRAAVSVFDLEQELRDADRFAPWLNDKTRARGARTAVVRLAELRGEVLAAE
jgi:hypothetical protein